jgi:hypothetical protein
MDEDDGRPSPMIVRIIELRAGLRVRIIPYSSFSPRSDELILRDEAAETFVQGYIGRRGDRRNQYALAAWNAGRAGVDHGCAAGAL